MKIQHDSLYPGLGLGQFYALYQDASYHDAVAKNGKVGREDVFVGMENGQLRSAWTCVVKRSLAGLGLDGVAGKLIGAKLLFPTGIQVRWRESHVYEGPRGELTMAMQEPESLKIGFRASAELEETSAGLVRHLQITFDKPPALLAPGMRIIAREIVSGLKKADAFTATWLEERPGQYRLAAAPPPDVDSASEAAYTTASEASSLTSYHSALDEQDLAGFSLAQRAPSLNHKRALSAPDLSQAAVPTCAPTSTPVAELTLREPTAPKRRGHRRWRSMFGACANPKVSN